MSLSGALLLAFGSLWLLRHPAAGFVLFAVLGPRAGRAGLRTPAPVIEVASVTTLGGVLGVLILLGVPGGSGTGGSPESGGR